MFGTDVATFKRLQISNILMKILELTNSSTVFVHMQIASAIVAKESKIDKN